MIVRCERCETRFKLDESRLPARGARVRCSRCKNAFFVIPPGSSREDLVNDIAADTAAAPSAASRTPGPTWDLEDGSGAPAESLSGSRPAPAAPSATPAAEPEDDNDWRFEDDLSGIDAGETAASLDLTGSAPAPAFLPSQDANEDSFADLGDPETWDLLSNDAPAAPSPSPSPERPAAEAARPAPAPVALPAPAPAVHEVATPASTPLPVSIPASPAAAARSAVPPAPRLAPSSRAAGWAAAAVLSAVVAWTSLSAPTSTPVVPAPVAGFDVTETRARVVDNAAAGPVLVVSGRLRNPGSAPRALGAPLHVQLLDAAGVPLADASALAGPELPTQRVREEAPERLRAAQAAGAAEFARRPVAAGGELSFDAVFGPLPRAAASVVLDVRDPAPGRGGR